MALTENDSGLETILVKTGDRVCETYRGLCGTFASLVYCCLDKEVMPGFHEKGLISEAKLKDGGLLLVLTGKRTETELMEIMELALPNIGAFPSIEAKAKYIIDVKSEQDVDKHAE